MQITRNKAAATVSKQVVVVYGHNCSDGIDGSTLELSLPFRSADTPITCPTENNPVQVGSYKCAMWLPTVFTSITTPSKGLAPMNQALGDVESAAKVTGCAKFLPIIGAAVACLTCFVVIAFVYWVKVLKQAHGGADVEETMPLAAEMTCLSGESDNWTRQSAKSVLNCFCDEQQVDPRDVIAAAIFVFHEAVIETLLQDMMDSEMSSERALVFVQEIKAEFTNNFRDGHEVQLKNPTANGLDESTKGVAGTVNTDTALQHYLQYTQSPSHSITGSIEPLPPSAIAASSGAHNNDAPCTTDMDSTARQGSAALIGEVKRHPAEPSFADTALPQKRAKEEPSDEGAEARINAHRKCFCGKPALKVPLRHCKSCYTALHRFMKKIYETWPLPLHILSAGSQGFYEALVATVGPHLRHHCIQGNLRCPAVDTFRKGPGERCYACHKLFLVKEMEQYAFNLYARSAGPAPRNGCRNASQKGNTNASLLPKMR